MSLGLCTMLKVHVSVSIKWHRHVISLWVSWCHVVPLGATCWPIVNLHTPLQLAPNDQGQDKLISIAKSPAMDLL
ncbi:hypothetical protein ACSBR1_035668 [Camellia fascicularis]